MENVRHSDVKKYATISLGRSQIFMNLESQTIADIENCFVNGLVYTKMGRNLNNLPVVDMVSEISGLSNNKREIQSIDIDDTLVNK